LSFKLSLLHLSDRVENLFTCQFVLGSLTEFLLDLLHLFLVDCSLDGVHQVHLERLLNWFSSHVDTLGGVEKLSNSLGNLAFPLRSLLTLSLEFLFVAVFEGLAATSCAFDKTLLSVASNILLLNLASSDKEVEGH